jgi:hypothetical protein
VLAPVAGVGALLLVVSLVFDGHGLGVVLWLGAGTYVAVVVHNGHRIDAAAPLVAVLLLLCGELAAWSLDERWRIRADPTLPWRRGAAVGGLALVGLAAATLAVALSTVSASHSLALTVVGAAAAVGAAGTGIWVARR